MHVRGYALMGGIDVKHGPKKERVAVGERATGSLPVPCAESADAGAPLVCVDGYGAMGGISIVRPGQADDEDD